MVATEKGGVLRRNRRYNRKTGESFQFSQSEVPEDIPILQAADHKECGPSSDSLSSESAAHSTAQSSTADTTPAQSLRRSSRKVKAPEKLNL